MTLLSAAAIRPAPRAVSRSAVAVALAFLIVLALGWPQTLRIWTDGPFFDTDDAMRMVQVRNWLAGQSWFDLVAHRLDPPAGVFMHWSRVIDVPLGVLVRLFDTALPPVAAERLARLVFPLGCALALLILVARTSQRLSGPGAVPFALVLLVTTGFMFGQFQPGRVDHHAPQIVLLALVLERTLAALDTRRAAPAVWAGAATALSLAISVENLPFFLVLAMPLPLGWIVLGEAGARALRGYGAGLMAGLAVMFVGTVPAARYGLAACDAFSLAHLVFFGVGGIGCLGLSLVRAGLPVRIMLGLGVGAAALGVTLSVAPACFGDPLAGLDPLVRAVWLTHVSEAQPLLTMLADRPALIPLILLPIGFAAVAAGFELMVSRDLARARWAIVAAALMAGVAASLWQVRATTSLAPIVVLGGAAIVARLARRRGPVWATAALLPFAPMFYALAIPLPDTAEDHQRAAAAACREPAALAPLSTLVPGLVFAPIDAGSHLLSDTPHSVLAAPYHRDNHGNRLVLDGFLATPDAARAIVIGSGARYVMLCPDSVQAQVMAERAPDGLAARLMAGAPPPWLVPVPLGPTPFRVYALASS